MNAARATAAITRIVISPFFISVPNIISKNNLIPSFPDIERQLIGITGFVVQSLPSVRFLTHLTLAAKSFPPAATLKSGLFT